MSGDEQLSELDQIAFDFFIETLDELSLEDKNVEKAMVLYHLKKKHPSIFNLACDFTTKMDEIDVSDEAVIKFMKAKLKDNCVQIYNLLQAEEDVSTDSISVADLTKKLSIEVEKLQKECEETRKQKDEEVKLVQQFVKELQEYADLFKQYIEEYAMGFKISYDQIKADLNCAKAQAMCMKSRLQETRAVAEEYGNPRKIQEAKATRETLEDENRMLQIQLKEQKAKLAQYEALDPHLLSEYRRLKEEVRCRQWAMNELNKSNCSDEIFL